MREDEGEKRRGREGEGREEISKREGEGKGRSITAIYTSICLNIKKQFLWVNFLLQISSQDI